MYFSVSFGFVFYYFSQVIGWGRLTLAISFVSKGFPYKDQSEELFIVVVNCMHCQHIMLSTFSLNLHFKLQHIFQRHNIVYLCWNAVKPNQSINQSWQRLPVHSTYVILYCFVYILCSLLQYFLKPLHSLLQPDDLKKIFFGIEVTTPYFGKVQCIYFTRAVYVYICQCQRESV